jgi:hypothetical protein
MKRNWLARAAIAATALLAGVLAPGLALAGSARVDGGPGGPQATARRLPHAATAVAPDSCLLFQQTNAAEQKYRKTNNNFHTYASAAVGAGYFTIDCGALTFVVPRGKQALVDLSATAELDCYGPSGANSWCEGRFLINGQPVPAPDNTGRSDTYSWDSGNGGQFDWQTGVLDQEYVARCPASTSNTQPCAYGVTLQGRLSNGATSLWVDDLTVRVDVSEGAVRVVAVAP